MGKVTFVVELEDGEEPPVSGGTEILGGRLSAVLWSDYRDDYFQPEQVDKREDMALIAAAPELLEALEVANQVLSKGRNASYAEFYGAVNKARAAIAKATGAAH